MTNFNATYLRFDGPTTHVAVYEHWSVLVRPKQCTLGALILVANGPETAFSDLPPAAFAEHGQVVKDIEHILSEHFLYSKINYLMLMMVDPHVHYHVLPRYEVDASFLGWSLKDIGWPGQPDLSGGSDDPELVGALVETLREAWSSLSRRN